MMPPAGTAMSAEQQLVLLQAWDACLALIYGGSTSMIWIGEDRQVHIAPHPREEAGQVDGDLEYLSWIGYLLGDWGGKVFLKKADEGAG